MPAWLLLDRTVSLFFVENVSLPKNTRITPKLTPQSTSCSPCLVGPWPTPWNPTQVNSPNSTPEVLARPWVGPAPRTYSHECCSIFSNRFLCSTQVCVMLPASLSQMASPWECQIKEASSLVFELTSGSMV